MLGNQYYPNAPELEGMIAWTATRAPSSLARLIAGIALRTVRPLDRWAAQPG